MVVRLAGTAPLPCWAVMLPSVIDLSLRLTVAVIALVVLPPLVTPETLTPPETPLWLKV